jgi:hypothetical protein
MDWSVISLFNWLVSVAYWTAAVQSLLAVTITIWYFRLGTVREPGGQSRAVTKSPVVKLVINPKAVYNHTHTHDNI